MTGLVRVPDFSGSASVQMTGPAHSDDPAPAIALLRDQRFLALTGAGLSTDSGIPDYRGPQTLARTGGRAPMTYQELVSGTAGPAALLGPGVRRLVADG